MTKIGNIIIESESFNDDYVTIQEICKKNGDYVEKNIDVIFSAETSKASFEIMSHYTGFIRILCKEEDDITIGSTIAEIYEFKDDVFKEAQKTQKNNVSIQNEDIIFSNQALDFINKYSIPKDMFKNKNFVSKKDVLEIIPENKTISAQSGEKIDLSWVVNNSTLIKVSTSKKRQIEYLMKGQNTLASNCSIKVKYLENKSSDIAFKNVKNSLTASILKGCTELLPEFPLLNACFSKEQIYVYNDILLGYAIDLDKGLKVVNLGNLKDKSLPEISKILVRKVKRYFSDKLEINELINSTFTITDLSSEGVYNFIPLINDAQSAILGITAVDLDSSSFILTMTFDHRVTEGRYVTKFLRHLKKYVESSLENNHT